MLFRLLATLVSLVVLMHPCFALESYSGINLTAPLITQDPPNLQGGRISLWHQPKCLNWEHTKIFFDGSVGYWWLSRDTPYNKLNIFALAPVLRYYVINTRYFSPFIDLSVGLSYLSETHIDDRNLGMHFAFQDQLGIGATFGTEKRLSLSLSAMHYSNASMARWNAGITIPLLLNIGFRF